MKNESFFSSVVLATALVLGACTNEEFDNGTSNTKSIPMSFTASQDDEGGTRTAINGTSVVWQKGDAISVFDVTAKNNAFTLAVGENTKDGRFDGYVGDYIRRWTAVYPYTASATIQNPANGGKIISGINMPSTQLATINSFDPKANIMTAYSTDDNLNFKQAVSFAKITVVQNCSRIVIKANGNESIAGAVTLTVATEGQDAGIATYSVKSNGSQEVYLIGNGQYFGPGTYYIGILPQTLSQGFTVECYYYENQLTNRVFTKRTNSSTEAFSRGKIVNLGTVSVENGWTVKSVQHYCTHRYAPVTTAPSYIDAVDLGLPSGTKWASSNLGARIPAEIGDFYAWGATSPWLTSYDIYNGVASVSDYCTWDIQKNSYNWNFAPYQTANATNAEQTRWSRYNGTGFSNQNMLQRGDDAAFQQWHGTWHIPTKAEFDELKAYTYWVWTNNYLNSGAKGYIVYKAKDVASRGKVSPDGVQPNPRYLFTDTHIFLPAAGCCDNKQLVGANVYGHYWTATLGTQPYYAARESFNSTGRSNSSNGERRLGVTIRPVCK